MNLNKAVTPLCLGRQNNMEILKYWAAFYSGLGKWHFTENSVSLVMRDAGVILTPTYVQWLSNANRANLMPKVCTNTSNLVFVWNI